MQLIPLTDSPRQSFDAVLGGQTVTITVWWQPLSESWYLSLADRDGASIASGRRMAVGVRLIRAAGLDGDLAVVPARDGDVAEVGRMGWGVTHSLYFLTAAETAAVEWVA